MVYKQFQILWVPMGVPMSSSFYGIISKILNNFAHALKTIQEQYDENENERLYLFSIANNVYPPIKFKYETSKTNINF